MQLQALGQSHPIRRLEVFGSVARGDATAASDLDLLVTLLVQVQPLLEKLVRERDDGDVRMIAKLLHGFGGDGSTLGGARAAVCKFDERKAGRHQWSR